MEDILERARYLHPKKRQRVASKIQELIDEEIRGEAGWTLGDYYLAVMKDILGNPVDDSRTTDNFYARVVIAACLYDAGYTQEMIGKVLHRNHSTVHHYLITWRDANDFPTAYGRLRWLYDKFTKKIDND